MGEELAEIGREGLDKNLLPLKAVPHDLNLTFESTSVNTERSTLHKSLFLMLSNAIQIERVTRRVSIHCFGNFPNSFF